MTSKLKFATFNILDSKYIHYNIKNCQKITKTTSDKDEEFRNEIIIKIIESNDFDVIFLQEVSKVFFELYNKSGLKNKSILVHSGELAILIKQNIVTDTKKVIDEKTSYANNRVLSINCKIHNSNFLLINTHLPSGIQENEKRKTIMNINKVIETNYKNDPNINVILAGDMNTSKYIFNLDTYKIHSVIPEDIKSKFATSFKLGKCEGNVFRETEKAARHNFIDDIYVNSGVKSSTVNTGSSFDNNYKLIYETNASSSDNLFKNKGAPYCEQKSYMESGICRMSTGENKYQDLFQNEAIKPWPSDHSLLFVELSFGEGSKNIAPIVPVTAKTESKEITGITDERISELVNLVVTKKFTIQQLEKGPRAVNKVIKNQELVEPTKEFKNIFTEFVINELVKTPDQTANFLKLVYGTFDKAIGVYIANKNLPKESIVFLYKGGNILRLLYQEVTKEFPFSVSETMENYYKDSFKRSDADFSIYILPSIQNFDQIYQDMCNLTFLLQNKIRNVFMMNLSFYFEYFRLNDQVKKSILSGYLNKLNESGTVKEKKFDFDGKFVGLTFDTINIGEKVEYTPKEDFVIAYVDRKTQIENYNVKLNYLHNTQSSDPGLLKLIDEERKIYGNNDKSPIFESANEISFGTSDYNVFFNLIRSKWAVTALFDRNDKTGDAQINKKVEEIKGGANKNINLDGELIDVSIIGKEDSFLAHFFEHLHDNMSTYKVGEFLSFKAPSIMYMIDDLEKIIFKSVEFPWLAPKYEKRIKRLCFMYLLLMFLNFPAGDKDKDIREDYINYIKTNIFDIILADADDKDNIAKNNIIKFLKEKSENVKENPFKNLIINLGKTLINPKTDRKELQKYVSVIVDNLNKMIEIIDLMHTFIFNKGVLTENQLLNADIISGGYRSEFYKKYIKYKTKYINIK